LVWLGAALATLGLSVDFLTGSAGGIGLAQLLLVGAGVVALLVGIAFQQSRNHRTLTELGQVVLIAAQVGLTAFVLARYNLESEAVHSFVLVVVAFGFIAHHFSPPEYRPRLFVGLSFVVILGIFGPLHSALLIGVGLGLIGICHLPASFGTRLGLIAVAACLLVAVRTDALELSGMGVVIPIIGSIFMFRLILYLYDLHNGKAPEGIWQRLAYFFLIPNPVFPFFPLVDPSVFRRTYYNADAMPIYQTGADWMLRGVVHLLLYRFINYYVVLAPEDVTSPALLVQYVISNFMLYLRISGLFHLIVGILHLFGYNLPATHKLYFLASSFTDLWRRINIYWKDFMQKMFLNPVFLRLKKKGLGDATSLTGGIVVVFLATWLLHAYQWFWLRGSLHFSTTDTLFWGLLAVPMIIEGIYQSKFGRRRTLGKKRPTVKDFALRVVRTLATFTAMAVLWSLWSAASVTEWVMLFSVLGSSNAAVPGQNEWLPIAAVSVIVALVIGVSAFETFWTSEGKVADGKRGRGFALPTFVTGSGVLVLALIVISDVRVYSQFGGRTEEVIQDLRVARLSARDTKMMQRGYYENLTNVNTFNSALFETYMKKPSDWVMIRESDAVRSADGYLEFELKPFAVTYYKGASFQTNRWGMRDRAYELEKPEGAYRVALVGASRAMGAGVSDRQTFERQLEKLLNRPGERSAHREVEILNFAVADYDPLRRLIVVEEKIHAFKPDAVFLIAHENDLDVRNLVSVIESGVHRRTSGRRPQHGQGRS